MADDGSDLDSDDDGVEYAGMQQPPLIKQLRTILSEYPDDGQILKEIIQNAEDAEASELKILYDGRPVNTEAINRRRRFKKYFKGPALVIYNDAEFTKDDWDGIKMLYCSNKEFDRTKVGRFGLGFKSVFHLTDYPMIISGENLLILDPHQKDMGKVCQTIKLAKLHKCRGMDVSDCLNCLSGIFEFSQDVLDQGYYKGTIFRFPLRDAVTNLSDNIYDESKVRDLINAFEMEASVTLLFLKSLEKIDLFMNVSSTHPVFTVKIDGKNVTEVKEERKRFLRAIKDLKQCLPQDTLRSQYEITIETTSCNENSINKSEMVWLVYNMFKGENMSDQLRQLSQDENLGYSPCVGVAFPLTPQTEFKGHVFCFLPLPLESRSLTGLPLHVNGFFALSQNRRHVKWATADQIANRSHKDKSIQWNEYLISEVLSEVYAETINLLIEKSNMQSNPENLVSMITRSIPDISAVDEKWNNLMRPLFTSLLKRAFLFTSNNGGQWITYNDAVFAEFRKTDNSQLICDTDVQTSILKLVRQFGENLVEVPPHIQIIIEKEVPSPQYITPSYICRLLKTSLYTAFTFEEKLCILQFILEDRNYRILEGLNLLPLYTGDFTCFTRRKSTSSKVYCCSDNDVKMFPGVEQNFVMVEWTQIFRSHFETMMQQGLYQIYPFSSSDFIPLLAKSITAQFGTATSPIRVSASVGDWLKIVWTYVKLNFPNYLDQFQNIPILPVYTYPDDGYNLYGLSGFFILKSFRGMPDLPHDVCMCLRNLSVTVMRSLPEYVIDHPEIMNRLVHNPSSNSILDILTKLSDSSISGFNQKCSNAEKESFLRYLQNCSPRNHRARTALRQMDLFDGSHSSKKLSVNFVGFLAPPEKIPVPYPKELLLCGNSSHREFAQMLGATEITQSSLVCEILDHLAKPYQTLYSSTDKQKLMSYIKTHMQSNVSVMQKARVVSFVSTKDGKEHKPCDLFDCNNDILRKLFPEGSRFPTGDFSTPDGVSFLRSLGLKSSDSLTANDIHESALYLHDHSDKNGADSTNEQAKAILSILLNRPNWLKQIIGDYGQTLSSALHHLNFVLSKVQPADYPSVLDWYGKTSTFCKPSEMFEGRYYRLVGSVSALLPDKISGTLAQSLKIKQPPVGMVIKQLNLIIQKYESQYKPEVLPLIKEAYTYLAGNLDYVYDELKNKECAWTGDGFCFPSMMYVTTKQSDISLEPYLYHLPSEFQSVPNIKMFFKRLGSKDIQDWKALKNVQELIKKKHTEQTVIDITEVKQDLQLEIKILNRMKEMLDEVKSHDKSILFPVHTINDQLVLKPAQECRYSNADWLKDISVEEGEEIFFVHPDVPRETAVMLGVPSLTEDLLSDAEGFEEWGQKEPLTRRIKNILKDYTDGFSVPKEIVQNADDAGATKVCFIYDERENEDAKVRLLDENMSSCQGPALWAYNNALFTKQDLENITKLSGATKEEDLKKIGKFGLGFCCVYNLTDVPSFITGDQMVIFDPHAKYLGKTVTTRNPGLKINLRSVKNQIMVKRLKNQFKPFNGILGCDLTMQKGIQPFDGTLFRFPLRTARQASESEISSKPYPKDEMKSLLNLFMKSAGNILLFTQNVSEIELYHIQSNAQSPEESKLIYSVKRNIVGNICRSDSGISLLYDSSMQSGQNSKISIVRDFSASVEKVKNGRLNTFEKVRICTQIDIQVDAKEGATRFGQQSEYREANWLVSWASGTGRSKDLVFRPEMKKALPLASVAALIVRNGNETTLKPLKDSPYGFYKESHFFCYLPLPVESPLPIHINGSFAVTANRRQLSCKTIDDKESFESQWNEALMGDAVCIAYIQLLEMLQELNFQSDKMYSEIWPVPVDKFTGNLLALQKSFYQKVVNDNPVVFRRKSKWEPYKNCIFLEPSLMKSEVGPSMFSAAIHFKKETMMELDAKIINCFKIAGYFSSLKEKIVTLESFYESIFFPNITSEYWDGKVETRDLLVHYALCHRTTSINHLLKNIPCIPSEPNGRLKKPEELIHPKGSVVNLFSEDEEMFISTKSCNGKFGNENVLKELASLGLITDRLPNDVVLGRVHSVETMTRICSKCGTERCKNVMNYLIEHVKAKDGQSILPEISNIKFLPVKKKPRKWEFPWRGDLAYQNTMGTVCQCRIHMDSSNDVPVVVCEKPSALYHKKAKNLVACQQIILEDTDIISYNYFEKGRLLAKLGVRGENDNNISVQDVVDNLICLCQLQTTDLSKESKVLLSEICADTYKYFDSKLSRVEDSMPDELVQGLNYLKTFPVILLNDQFLKPDMVALYLGIDCSPCLYGINNDSLRYKRNFLKSIGVKENFQFEDVLEVVLSKQNKFSGDQLSEVNLDLFCRLLDVLSNAMKLESITAKDLQVRCGNKLLVPDENCILKPVDDLCMDDTKSIKRSRTMTFAHAKISLEIANALGIKSKKRGQLKDHSKRLPFGQYEELTTRLKRILTGYPCDEGILKELLQNADDAGATEVHLIKDFNHHPCDHVFEKWKPLQGPALLVYNDRAFSEADIEGIQKLGIGSKSDDPTKTGQFGIGFNAVYHLTDAPSFLTKGEEVVSGETLCVMDPNRLYVEDAEEDSPGMQYIELEEIKETYPDVFGCYYEQKLLQETGTVFRLPLRNYSMAKSSCIKNDYITQESVNKLLDKFKVEMLKMLLFVKNVEKIKISDITSGEMKEEYSVEVCMSEEEKEKRTEFMDYVKEVSTTLHQNWELTSVKNDEVCYTVTVKDTKGLSKSWLVVQRVGLKKTKEGIEESVLTAYRNGEIGMLPTGGVALPLSAIPYSDQALTFTAFCFLPLPCSTGLPVIVNGHFDLDHETRRSLWKNDKIDNRVLWNETLIKSVIVPAYLSALQLFKAKVCLDNGSTLEERKLKQALDKYHSVFPDIKKASENYWKILTTSFYKQLFENEEDVFVCYKQSREVGEFDVSFYPLISENCRFTSVFDNMLDQLTKPSENTTHMYSRGSETESQKSHILRHTCKMLGMKLLDSPLILFENLKEAGVSQASMITPDYMIEFLKSFGNEGVPDRCSLQGLDKEITETTFLEKRRVIECLLYCKKSETFHAQIEGLPLCLTNDDVLHTFSSANPFFCTKYCTLFKNSSSSFLSSDMFHHFSGQFWAENKIFKDFDMAAVVMYLPETLPSERFQQNETMKWQSSEYLDVHWMKQFWKLIHELTMPQIDNIKDKKMKTDQVLQLLNPLQRWSLLPCVKNELRFGLLPTKSKILLPVSGHEMVVLKSSFSGIMEKTLSKLNLPEVDKESLDDKAYDMITTHLIAKQNKPLEMLNCLFLHRQEMNFLNEEECNSISQYFSQNLQEILRCASNDEGARVKLKDLPIHVTIQGTHTSLANQWNVLLLPKGMPLEGIENWGEQARVILLKSNENLGPLYEFLQFTESSLCDVYTNHIFNTFGFLSESAQKVHLRYIKDNLLLTSGHKYSQDQKRLIEALKHLPFIQTAQGSVMTASNFYSPHNCVFNVMDLTFPPEPFCKSEWKKFMELAGMITTVTPALFMSFIEQVQREGMHAANVEAKSEILVDYLFGRDDLQKYDLHRIAEVKFVVPHEVSKFLQRVHKQYNTDRLICFSGSVTNRHQNLVWTRCDLLPSWANPYEHIGEYACQLNVCKSPDVQTVVHHVQNICDSMKEKVDRNKDALKKGEIHPLMNQLYKYLHEKSQENDTNKQIVRHGLELKPLVYLPNFHKFVSCNSVVKELNDYEVIKPYLFPLPDEYVPYFKLFEFLGTNKRVACDNFARVLENMHIDISRSRDGVSEMHPNELRMAGNVMWKLFMSIEYQDTEKIDLKVNVLYLPSREKILFDSSKLIYSDWSSLEKVVQNEEDCEFFIGFDEMGIHFRTGGDCMKKLPEKYRPRFLSKMIKSSVDTSHLQYVDSEKAVQLQEFIQTPEFIESILRLIFDELRENMNMQKIDVDEKRIISQIQSITVQQVLSIEKTRSFKGVVVRRDNIPCYYEKLSNNNQTKWMFYFTDGTDNWIQTVDHKFAEMIKACTGRVLKQNSLHIFRLLTNMHCPENFRKLLDDLEITEYAMAKSSVETVYPPAGTIIHPKWHFLLDNSFTEFEIGEYVALQLADDEISDEKESECGQVFMYAIVQEKVAVTEKYPSVLLSMFQTYILAVGSGQQREIPAYKIYKLNRNTASDCREIAPAETILYNRQSTSETFSRPLEDVYREIRQILKSIWGRSEIEKKHVIKRLLRKWHPDKNYGNEEYATKVFQYIKQCIQRLENNEDIDVSESSQSGGTRSNPMYEAWFNDVNRSCGRDRHYQQSAQQARSNSRGYGYRGSHSYSSRTEETPLPQEAKRWYRQACNDLIAAETFYPKADDISAHNWICYHCHQAAEKVMKAVWYSRNANRVTKSHELTAIASGLEPEIQELAMSLESLLGNHTHMRYPDLLQMPKIPSDMFDAGVSSKAIEITKQLCEVVSSILW